MTRPTDPIRGWVARLGSYLRIFGIGPQPDPRYIDVLVIMAKEREAEAAFRAKRAERAEAALRARLAERGWDDSCT